jgi:tetratricopeptide (TPR) repeat protein
MLATAATAMCVMYLESGDVARSIDTADQALKEVEAAGLEGTDEHIRLGAAFVFACYERGDLLYAARRADELIEVADRVGTPRARGSIYWNAATVANERGQVSEALRLTDRAVALFAEEEGSRDLPRLRMQYACLLLNHDRPQAVEALRQLDLAEADPAVAGSRLDLGTAATFRSRAHLLLGEVDDAAEHAARALQLLGPSDHIEHASALILLGDVGTAQLDMDLAEDAFSEAERVLSEMAPSRSAAKLWRELGDGLRDLGETHRAVTAYDHAFRIVGIAPRPTPVEERRPGRAGSLTTG